MRRFGCCALVLAALLPAPLAASATEQVVAKVGEAAGLTAYGGHVVWSQRDPATGRWQLRQWHAGHVSRLAVSERGVPFDADAGPDAHGRPVLVYSRCRLDPAGTSPGVYYATADWTFAEGCDIFETDLTTGRSHRLGAVSSRSGSETTPSIWRGSLAFARHGAHRGFARVLIHGGRRTARQPAGTLYAAIPGRPKPAAAPDSLDLGPRVLTFIRLVDDTGASGNDDRAWELWIDSRRSHNAVEPATGGTGECNKRVLISPNAVGLGAQWLYSTGGCGMFAVPPERSDAFAFDWATRSTTQASPQPFAAGLARDGQSTWLLRAQPFPLYVYDTGETIDGNPTTCSSGACELVRATGLAFARR